MSEDDIPSLSQSEGVISRVLDQQGRFCEYLRISEIVHKLFKLMGPEHFWEMFEHISFELFSILCIL